MNNSLRILQWRIRLAADDPAAVPRRLFVIRADMLVGKQTSAQARATLSGLLIGQELISVRQYWTDQIVTLVGASTLRELYLTALGVMGVSGRVGSSKHPGVVEQPASIVFCRV